MAALVIDVGSWYHAAAEAADRGGRRRARRRAGSPDVSRRRHRPSPSNTRSTTTPACPRRRSRFPIAGTIDVSAQADTPGIFVPVFERILHSSTVHDVVTVHAQAQAQVSVPLVMKNVAPVAVKNTAACVGHEPELLRPDRLTLAFDESQVSSSTIGLINLTCHSTASTACGSSSGIGGSQLKDWIESGYPDALPANQWYGVKTGETDRPGQAGVH